jgi:hypothetical protein
MLSPRFRGEICRESRGGQDGTVHDMPEPAKKTAKKAAKKTGSRRQRSA